MNLKSVLAPNIFILKIGGLWPTESYNLKNFYTFYALICFIFIVFSHNLSQLINVYFIYDQLETLTASIVVMLTEFTGMIKFFLFYRNIRIVKKLMKMLDGELFQPKNRKQELLLQKYLINWRRVYIIFSLSAAMTLLLWGLFPIFDGSHKEKKLPFIAWYPYDYKTTPKYEITYFYQIVANYFIAFTNQNIDAFVSALLMFVAAECDLLCHKLRNLKEKNNFIECIKHHQEILRQKFTKIII